MSQLRPAELAWYVTGRFYRGTDDRLADYGYFIHLAGLDCPLFNGAPSEKTAHFTFAARPFAASTIVNGELNLALDAVGDFSLFLQREPCGDFDDPQSFAGGECVATFRRTSMVVGTTVSADNGAGSQPVVSLNAFSARLVSSAPFTFEGRQYDLGPILGYGITQFGTAATTPVSPVPAGYSTVVPFSGSAIALAGVQALARYP
ncbi:hypothetical protein [Tahibacter amnicola]|uniref:Uncharacterized protein n=1 Tax=Tahibacter amnicola TaxID=2976241 RepID=A0ABY6BQ45_9GAMM|nr:hypothetical protein [Tahibacter amnicola]UXI69897.1 hypothetical protein N4264_09800 [Tahibacter amnicola]